VNKATPPPFKGIQTVAVEISGAPPPSLPQNPPGPPPFRETGAAAPGAANESTKDIRFRCPHCSQLLDAEPALSATAIGCPSCQKIIIVPDGTQPIRIPAATPPPAPNASHAGQSETGTAKTTKQNESGDPLSWALDFVRGFTGFGALEGFSVRQLFSSNAFRRHSGREMESYFVSAGQNATPDLDSVSTEWPKPWAFWRILAFGLLVFLGFHFGFVTFENTKLLPGLMIVGAFVVPLSCTALFFEYNVLHNISVYQILKFTLAGGVLSMVAALILYQVTSLETFLGATSAGIVEEVAKLLTVVFMLRACKDYRWILNAMVVGSAVGAGFAGFETAGFIFVSMESGESMFATLVLRAVSAPFLHVVWTAATAGALWRVRQDKPFDMGMLLDKRFLRVFAFVVLLHMFWNSNLLFMTPKGGGYARLWLFGWAVSLAGSWYLALLLIQDGLRQVKSAKVSAVAEKAR